uniref:G-protein coupled receptors family 1 profile domain-containing protein n=1 Tax=Acrobeloides nanus TaxID=290746 RepID=A0A914DTQ3_9BILA
MRVNISYIPHVMGEDSSLFRTHPISAIILCLFVILLILATLIGNAMVCLAVLMVRKLKQQPANLLIVSLAIADFCVGLIVMPIGLVAIIEDRWILALRTRRRIFGYIAIVWLGALFVSVSPLIVLPWKRIDHVCQVPQHRWYQLYATIISFYGPCLIMVILYVRMWKAAKRLQRKDRLTIKWSLSLRPEDEQLLHKKKFGIFDLPYLLHHHHNNNNNNSAVCNGVAHHINNNIVPIIKPSNGICNGNSNSSPRKFVQRPSAFFHAMRMPLMHSRSHEKTEDKARKTLGVVMGVFIICWLPFFLLALLKSEQILHVPKWLDILLLWLGYLNSMLNPMIYCKYNREFRVPFREMLCCRFKTLQDVMRHETFNSKYGPSRVIAQRRSSLLSQNDGCPSSNGETAPRHDSIDQI